MSSIVVPASRHLELLILSLLLWLLLTAKTPQTPLFALAYVS